MNKFKVVLLSGASSIHTIRWANSLCLAGHEVHVVSQHPAIDPFHQNVILHKMPYRGTLGYFTMVPAVKRLLLDIKPDIVNAHYASGYATTARLANYHPWLLSVWGSDIYDFPKKSFIHKWLVRKNLRAADHVASTSHCMALETYKLVPELKDISITPFGVDLESFKNIVPVPAIDKSKIVIGTVKTMSYKYGIDTLIRAFAILVSNLEDYQGSVSDLELRLVGAGDQISELEALAESLGVSNKVSFVGRIPHAQVPTELEKIDIFVALSRLDSESFGVAILEAGAAGRPVVVSDAGGLPEVTVHDETGYIVSRESPESAATAIEKLLLNAELRHRMGGAGKAHVANEYSWDACLKTMLDVYAKTIDSSMYIKTNV